MKFFKNPVQRAKYLDEVKNSMANCENLAIVSPEEAEEIHEKNKLENKATITVNLDNNEILIATYSLVELQDELFNSLQDDKRQIYVLTNDGKLVASHNFKDEDFQKTLSLLPKNMKENKPVIFGDVKNQPLVYVKKDNPKITIIVNTTEAVTDKAINKNPFKNYFINGRCNSCNSFCNSALYVLLVHKYRQPF